MPTEAQVSCPGHMLRVAIPAALFLIVLFRPGIAAAQTVVHPLAEISGTARYYSYTHLLSPTEKKDIEYIIVRSSNGDVKTVFNACDVCYKAYKGYSQSGSDLRCNNCGNRFAIDTLGGKNTAGTCHPGYLAHRVEGDHVVIEVSDLITGAYYFRTQAVTGVDRAERVPLGMALRADRNQLTISFPSEGQRSFRVYSILGQLQASRESDARLVRFSLSGFVPGAYLLTVQDTRGTTTSKFLVY